MYFRLLDDDDECKEKSSTQVSSIEAECDISLASTSGSISTYPLHESQDESLLSVTQTKITKMSFSPSVTEKKT